MNKWPVPEILEVHLAKNKLNKYNDLFPADAECANLGDEDGQEEAQDVEPMQEDRFATETVVVAILFYFTPHHLYIKLHLLYMSALL